jgi:branched-chain amino acid transport system substrate-binding protein
MTRSRWLGTAAAVAAAGLLAAGCGSSSSSTSSGASSGSSASSTSATSATTSASTGSFSFPAAKKATGSPYVFGMINDETGAVTFPEARQGAIAAMQYVNNYLGGINGHPIVIDSCIGDGTPAGAARCANELVAKHPLAILGAADVGAPASIPIYAHANLAYIGGIPFTPVPFVAPNSIQFWSVSVGDNAAAAVYAGTQLKVKSVALMYFSNPQGESILPQIVPVFKAAGVTTVKQIPLSPTSPDPSPQAALIESSGAQLAYIDVPNGCGNVLKSLKSVGYSGKLMGIDPCSAPPVITAA